MVSDNGSPKDETGARHRRPAPTIELKATEIPSEPVATSAPSAPAKPESVTVEPARVEPAKVEPAKPEPIVPEPAPVEPVAGPQAARDDASSQQPPPPPPPPWRPSWLASDLPGPMIASGAVGAVAALLLVLLVWLMVPRSGDAVTTLSPRLHAIETQLRDLAARPAPAGGNAQAVEAVSARLAKLEQAAATARPGAGDPALAARVDALENTLKPVGGSIAALTRRADEADSAFRNLRGRADAAEGGLSELRNTARSTTTADHDEIARLSERIVTLEKADRAKTEELAKRAAASGHDKAVRLAVAVAALRTTMERGEPFTAEFDAVRPLSGDAEALAAMEPFASTGLPNPAALGRELAATVPAMHRAAGSSPREGGFLDRLQANAEKLVRIRPVEEKPGEEPVAILSRVESRAVQADLAAAIAELNKLPPDVRAPAQAWIAKAQAREKAVGAIRRLAADSVAALKANP